MNDNTDKGLIIRQLMTYGSIIATITIVYSLILYSTGNNEFIPKEDSDFLTNLRILIIGLGIFYSVKHLADKILQKKLTFGQFLSYGVLTGVFFGILDSAYFLIFTQYIAPSTLNNFFALITPQYNELGIPQEQIDMA